MNFIALMSCRVESVRRAEAITDEMTIKQRLKLYAKKALTAWKENYAATLVNEAYRRLVRPQAMYIGSAAATSSGARLR